MPSIAFRQSPIHVFPFTWLLLSILYSLGILCLSSYVDVVVAAADVQSQCTLDLIPSSLSSSNVAVVNLSETNGGTLKLAFEMCPYIADTNVTIRVPSPLVITTIAAATTPLKLCARLDVLIRFDQPPPLLASLTLITHPLTCSQSVPFVVPGVRVSSAPSDPHATVDRAVLPPPKLGSRKSSLSLWVDAFRESGRFISRTSLARYARLSVQPQLPHVKVLLLPAASLSPNLHIEWRQPSTNFPLSLVDFVTLSVLIPSFPISSAKLTLELPSALAVLRFRQQRAVLSTEGGGVVSAVLTPQLPSSAYATLVLHHPSGNISITQKSALPNSNNTSLPNLSEPVFLLPPLPSDPLPQPLPWHLFVTHEAGQSIAKDQTSGFQFTILHPPSILRILPDRMHMSERQTIVYLLGKNLVGAVVIQDGVRLSSRRKISSSATHIAFKLFRTFRRISRPRLIVISVMSPQRLESSKFNLTVDPGLPVFTARVLNAVQSTIIRHFTIPAPCGSWQQPSIAASLAVSSDLPVTFNFSVRPDESTGNQFLPFYSGNSSIATFQNTSHFSSSPRLVRRTLAVLIEASHNFSSYTTVVIIDRRVDDQKVGLSVTEMPAGSSNVDTALQLQAFVPPLTFCVTNTPYHVDFFWKIDDEPVLSPFGNFIVVATTTAFTYAVDVHVVDNSNMIVYRGAGYGNIETRYVSLSVVVNGGLSSVTLPTGLDSYNIHADFVSSAASPDVLFDWSCVELPQRRPCSPPLWSTSARRAPSFNISTKGLKNGMSVEYSIQVSDSVGSTQSQKTVLTIGPNDTALFPETVTRAYGYTDPETVTGDFDFQCFEHVTWSWDVARGSGLSSLRPYFWLKQDVLGGVNIFDQNSDALLTHNGYWAPQHQGGRLLGIDLSALDTGQYKLFATSDGDARSVPTHSWDISVRPCVLAFMSDPSAWNGVVNRTVFHISASTKPAIQAVYVLTLQATNSTAELFERNRNLLNMTSQLSHERIGSENGNFSRTTRGFRNGAILSFVVPFIGNFFIVIDVYDLSGSKILTSVRTTGSINITSSSETKSLSVENALASSILQSDHDAVISILKIIPAQTNLSEPLIEALTAELVLLSSYRAPPVVTAADAIQASTSLVILDASRNLTRQAYLRGCVERLVASSLAHAASEGALRSPLQSFYATIIKILKDLGSEAYNVSVLQGLDESRQSSVSTFSILLSTGRECGSMQQAVIPFGFSSQFDEFRLGVECYTGQVSYLAPEPYTYETCSNESISAESTGGSIIMSLEQADISLRDDNTNIFRSSIVRTVFLKRATDLNRVSTTTLAWPSVCYRTRLVVNITDVATSLTSRQPQEFYCHNAGEIVVRSGNTSQNTPFRKESTVSDFKLINDRQIFAQTIRTESIALQLHLNATKLLECQNSSITVQPGSLKVVPIVTGIVTGLGLLLTIVIVLCLVRRKEKPLRLTIPRDGRGWDAMLESGSYTASSDGSFGFVGRDSSSPVIGWDTAYETTGNLRAGSALADEDHSGSFDNRGFNGEDVLAYGDRSVERLGAARAWGGLSGAEPPRYELSRLGEMSEDDLTSGDRGTSDTSELATPVRSQSATISSSIDGYIQTSGSTTEDDENANTFILEDVFGRNFYERN